MDATGGGAPTPAAAAALGEGIALLFSRWTALQMAVENGWGGPDSRCKEAEFAAEVHAWFAAADPNELYIDDLEELLDDRLGVLFRTVAEDGSVAEVAEKLMVMHEECLAGNFSSVERLRASSSGVSAVAQSRRAAGDDEDGTSSSDEEDGSEMMEVDELKSRLPPAARSGPWKQRDSGSLPPPLADEDGWSVVTSRRHRGKK